MSRAVKSAFVVMVIAVGATAIMETGSKDALAVAVPEPPRSSGPTRPSTPTTKAHTLTFAQQNPVAACEAAVAVMMSNSPKIMSGHITDEGLAHVEYRRPDDGKRWQWRCRVEKDGTHLTWAAFDAFGNGIQGRWRTEDEIIVDIDDKDTTKVEAWVKQAGSANSGSFKRELLDLATS